MLVGFPTRRLIYALMTAIMHMGPYAGHCYMHVFIAMGQGKTTFSDGAAHFIIFSNWHQHDIRINPTDSKMNKR